MQSLYITYILLSQTFLEMYDYTFTQLICTKDSKKHISKRFDYSKLFANMIVTRLQQQCHPIHLSFCSAFVEIKLTFAWISKELLQ